MRKYMIRPLLALFLLISGTAFVPPSGTPPPADVWSMPASTGLAMLDPASDYSVIDSYARNTPEQFTKDLNTLSVYLTSPARSDLAKARSVYAWVLSHVRYDDATYSGRRYHSEELYAKGVLQSRRTVCTGFALLYKQLLRKAGVEVVNVKGFARSNDEQAGVPVGPIDHEWNAVKLDGDWYLLDLAWASTTMKNGKPNDFYFLTEPKRFVAAHFPAEPRWQLLGAPVTKAEFDRYPKLYDAYFRLGFDDDFPKNGLIRASGTVSLTLDNAEQPVEFMASYSRPGGSTAHNLPVTVRKSGNSYSLQVKMPAGKSTLYVFAKPKGPARERVKSYEGIASFTVVNE
ncbi:hypothetical protein GCM10023189_50310 [Nibrella saemangeumensis]|uniref:Transglutaminase-like domain-containing protein n=1 Tax=Nibrella saemangeumensis TaxID=1084526 RepID=A0ABP8NL03_9BACT